MPNIKSKSVAKVAAVLGVLVAVGAFLNLPLRPAWAWELEELNQRQLQYQIEFYQADMNRVDKELYNNRKEEREYLRNDEQVDEWVFKERATIQHEQVQLQQKLESAQGRLILESK